MSTELEQQNERLRRANTGYGKVTAQLVAERDEWKARAEWAEARLSEVEALCDAAGEGYGEVIDEIRAIIKETS